MQMLGTCLPAQAFLLKLGGSPVNTGDIAIELHSKRHPSAAGVNPLPLGGHRLEVPTAPPAVLAQAQQAAPQRADTQERQNRLHEGGREGNGHMARLQAALELANMRSRAISMLS